MRYTLLCETLRNCVCVKLIPYHHLRFTFYFLSDMSIKTYPYVITWVISSLLRVLDGEYMWIRCSAWMIIYMVLGWLSAHTWSVFRRRCWTVTVRCVLIIWIYFQKGISPSNQPFRVSFRAPKETCEVNRDWKGCGKWGETYKSLGGGFNYFLFSPLPGEMVQFD